MRSILKKVKRHIIFIIIYLKALIIKLIKRKKIYFLLGVPWHGNMGDQAIVFSERIFLKKVSNKTVIEIPSQYLMWYFQAFKKLINNHDILVHGGGFIGSLWPEEDKMIRKVLERFPSNNIIVLPQTLYFTEEDRKIIDIYRELVDNCSNIKICVREKYSYEFALQNGINNVLLVPDMVTYITKDDLGITTPITRIKNKIIFCLRSDKEKNVSDQSIEKIKKYLKNKNIYYIDTFENRTVYPVNRKRNLRKKLLEFSDSEAVITDRLHGMVFAAIMNTPCMVLTNCNYKIKGVYEWISNNSFIHFVDEEKDIYYVLELLKENTDCSYNNKTVRESFEPLIKLLGD